MRPGKGKAKGSAFERQICKELSLWVSVGEHQDLFWRSAMSGGRATVGAKKGIDLRRQAGDVSAVAPEGHSLTDRFFIELKTYKDLRLGLFFLEGKGPLAGFWKKACQEAKRYGKNPILIVKQNQIKPFVLTRMDTIEDLVMTGALDPHHRVPHDRGLPYPRLNHLKVRHSGIVVCDVCSLAGLLKLRYLSS